MKIDKASNYRIRAHYNGHYTVYYPERKTWLGFWEEIAPCNDGSGLGGHCNDHWGPIYCKNVIENYKYRQERKRLCKNTVL